VLSLVEPMMSSGSLVRRQRSVKPNIEVLQCARRQRVQHQHDARDAPLHASSRAPRQPTLCHAAICCSGDAVSRGSLARTA
jgi:hypothetical protein